MITVKNLTKQYGVGDAAVTVLRDVNFEVPEGQILAIVGPSGAGKSTLAQCINLLERPTSGSVIVNGDDLAGLSQAQLRIARRRIGTIFQSDGLFARRTAAENVALPLEYLGVTAAETKRRVAELLDRVGLSARANFYPHELSGGQRQRVGIARALALKPSVVLSDEATSGLDPDSTKSIVSLLKDLRDDLGLSILFISHEMDTVRSVADSVGRLDRGSIVEQGTLIDLLRDPSSQLGADLRPHGALPTAVEGQSKWQVTYLSAGVPSDWLHILSTRVKSPVALLSANIESLNGALYGQATIGLTNVDENAARASVEGLALSIRRVGFDHPERSFIAVDEVEAAL